MSSSDGSTVIFRRAPAGLRPKSIQDFARQLEREVAKGRAFDCLITGDAELRRLNRRFRGRDEATDVLSFPAGKLKHAPPSAKLKHGGACFSLPGIEFEPLGDIAISLMRARAQARRFGHSAGNEVRILMLHGLLHLMGLDHESDGGRMARAEKRWRARLGLPAGLIERVRA
jgi:probable rRNA maturation factor